MSRMRIMAGPFRGMKYVDEACGSSLHPKLLGTYERELFPIVESFRAAPLDLVIDIGAAEGYYAVGLLHAGIARKVIAYEAEESGQRLLRKMATANGVENRLTIKGRCAPADLQREFEALGEGRALIVMDVEGAESALLDPDLAPGLRRTPVLVELHELCAPGILETIRERFTPSHRITRIDPEPRRMEENLCGSGLVRLFPEHIRAFPLFERGVMTPWFWMEPL